MGGFRDENHMEYFYMCSVCVCDIYIYIDSKKKVSGHFRNQPTGGTYHIIHYIRSIFQGDFSGDVAPKYGLLYGKIPPVS